MGSKLSTRLNSETQMSYNTTNIREYIAGDHETHLSDGSEGELHTRNVVCEKNPGHTKFIPVNELTIERLPEGQRDSDLCDYISAVADLTVKIDVRMTSKNRPKFWPKTNKPYPFHNIRVHEDWRTGSGMLYRVCKYIDGIRQNGGKSCRAFRKCWCRKCEYSDLPSDVWWEFYVFTATHVVFDYNEACYTTLRLFYDTKDSPLVIVDKVSVHCRSIERDRCELKCVTCDKNLGDKLETLEGRYDYIWFKVKNKYKNSNVVHNLTFIVSHPHGCTKQVSVGQWIKKYKVGKYDRKRFTYTTCTCPGSSGAQVYCVGDRESWWWWFYPGLVHSGTNYKHKYNYSGVGGL